MGKSQRTKGAVYEREVMREFSEFFGQTFERNIGQARDGGNDGDVGPLVLEMKRRKSLKTLMSWYEQAATAATERYYRKVRAGQPTGTGDHIPVVVMREDSGSSMVLLSLEDFLNLLGEDFLATTL
jgi:hypothetical protein